MRVLRILGVILIVLGVVDLAAGGIKYTRRRESMSVGPLSVSVREQQVIPRYVGAIAALAGVAFLITSRRRGS